MVVDKIRVEYRDKKTLKWLHEDFPFDVTKDSEKQLKEACEPYKYNQDVSSSWFTFISISGTWMEMRVYYPFFKRYVKL